MRFALKDFQVTAANKLMDVLQTARFGVTRRQLQAVILSSPTGSGKTVIATEMIERILSGHDGSAPDRNAVFLWLSDSPELNEQSKNKIKDVADELFDNSLVTVEHPFNHERLEPRRNYFLNTQKLTAASLLTKNGNFQQFTIWQIIENTVRAAPGSFYLLIDEAHRGMRDAEKSAAARTRAENARMTIVQKFVKGDKSVGLSPIPLIVGISATPDRFYAVLKETNRTQHPVTVGPEQVRGSGLIKDRIKVAIPERGKGGRSRLVDARPGRQTMGQLHGGMADVLHGQQARRGAAGAGRAGGEWHRQNPDAHRSGHVREDLARGVRRAAPRGAGALLRGGRRRARRADQLAQDRAIEDSGRLGRARGILQDRAEHRLGLPACRGDDVVSQGGGRHADCPAGRPHGAHAARRAR
jgi:hypothetical protein